MAKAKKVLSLVIAVLMMTVTFLTNVPAFAAEDKTTDPSITWVGIEHSPLIAGDTETFTVSTKNADKVQYQITMKNEAGVEENLTNGWGTEVDGNVAYPVTPAKKFELGKYTLTVSAKRVSDGKIANYTAYINTVAKDDANRVYANGAVDIAKTEYSVGEKVVVNGLKDLGGIAGPYLYKLHVYNVTTGEWTKNVQAEYKNTAEWTPTQAGTYALLIYVNTEKSTTWAKYAANPSSDVTRGTYEAWKYQVITVTDSLKVTGVKAPNQKTVKVTFNKDLGTVEPMNFSIAEKEDEYSLIDIEEVSVDKNVATITTYDELSDDTAYVLTTTDVPSADGKQKLASAKNEFKFVDITDAASIAFAATKYAPGDDVEVVIKDKDGNDITPNFDLSEILDVETSNEAVVEYDDAEGVISAVSTGKAIVNVIIDEANLETGNTIITVDDTLALIGSIGAADIDTPDDSDVYSFDFEDPSLVVYEDSEDAKLAFEVLDKDGDTLEATDESVIEKEFKSLTPSVLVVDTNVADVTDLSPATEDDDASAATLIPVKEGTAQVLLKATFKDKTVSKVVTVTVKAEKEATSLKVDKSTVKVVGNSGITQKVTATLYDQYGNDIALDPAYLTVDDSRLDEDLVSITDVEPNDDDAVEITLTPGIVDDETSSKTVKLTYDDGDVELKASFTVSVVEPGDFVGYAAVADDTKLDLYDENDDETPISSLIKIYAKDDNGNYIYEVDRSDVAVVLDASNDNVEVTTDGAIEVTAADTGSSTVTVKVGTTEERAVKVGTITFTVVDTEPVATTFKQSKATVKVGTEADLFDVLFGEDGVFSAKDQFGDSATITADDVDVYSTDTSVVSVEDGVLNIEDEGTVKLIVVADKVFEITVVVDADLD